MPGALSYLTVRPPEALSYGAPNVDFSPIGNLPKVAREGEQYARDRALQTMFQPGTPGAEALARGDYGGILQQLAQTGGAPAVSQFLPQMMGLEAGKQAFPGGGPGQGGPATGSPGPVSQAKQPGSIGTHPYGPEAAGAGGQPAMSSTGMDNQGQSTVRSLFPGDQDVPQAVMDRVATAAGVRPSGGMSAADQPLTPQQAARAEQIIRSRGAVGGAPQPTSAPTAQPQPSVRTAQAQQSPQETGIPGDTPQAYQQLLQEQEQLRNQAGRYSGAFPKVADELSKKADDKGKLAQAMAERMGKVAQTKLETSEATRKEQGATDVKYYAGQYEKIQKADDDSDGRLQTLKLGSALLNDPNFASGAGADFQLKLRQIAARLPGFDPNIAQPQELYKKVVGEAILEQIRSLGGQGLGQVRQSEIGVIKDISQSLDASVATNRTRTELATRLLERWTKPIAEMAREYKGTHGSLDANWEKIRANYINKTPLLNDDELKDVRRISPPVARNVEDLKRIGWRDGQPFRTPDGRILTHAPGVR